MVRRIYMLAHRVAAGAFMFFVHTLVLRAANETALAWPVVFGLGAAGLAWHQSNW
jgi:hypothetical protein